MLADVSKMTDGEVTAVAPRLTRFVLSQGRATDLRQGHKVRARARRPKPSESDLTSTASGRDRHTNLAETAPPHGHLVANVEELCGISS